MWGIVVGCLALQAPMFQGRLLLPDGRPAANGFLVNQSFGQGEGRTYSDRIDADAEGRFSMPRPTGTKFRVFAYSKDQRNALMAMVPTQDGDIRLEPACETEIKITSSLETPKGQLNMLWGYDLSLPWLADLNKDGVIKSWMPRGTYHLTLFSEDFDLYNAVVKLEKPVEKVSLEAKPNPFGAWRGQPAPELKVSSPLGRRLSLDQYKGKYLVLEFWGWWCAPCVESSLPAFRDLVNKHPEWKGKVEVLAVHENAGGKRTWTEILPKVQKFKKDLWSGSLPFEMVLEDAGSLSKTFGIKAYPTAVLIDPQGKVVNRVDAGILPGFLPFR